MALFDERILSKIFSQIQGLGNMIGKNFFFTFYKSFSMHTHQVIEVKVLKVYEAV